MTDDKHDQIVRRRVRRIAEAHGLTPAEVDLALDRHPVNAEPGAYLRRTPALDLIELAHVFHAKAIDERDPVSGALCVKIHERRATLLGLNPPRGHAVQIISAPARHESSTAGPKRVLARLAASRIPSATDDEDDGATH